jgi:putative transposase
MWLQPTLPLALPSSRRSGRTEPHGSAGRDKTYKEKLSSTSAHTRALEEILWRCRDLYNTALEQRTIAHQRRRLSPTRYEQEVEPKQIRAEFPDYAAINSHILQDVLARFDKTYQTVFRRILRGEKAGFPRIKSRPRYHSFTFKEYGNGAIHAGQRGADCHSGLLP